MLETSHTEGPRHPEAEEIVKVFQEYMEPILLKWLGMTPRPDHAELNKMCQTPWLIWNATVAQSAVQGGALDTILDDMRAMMQTPEESSLIDFWIARKNGEFAKHRFVFGEFEYYADQEGDLMCRVHGRPV